MAGAQETRLRIVNNTITDIINTTVTGIDVKDWDGSARPDKNFHKEYIPAKGSKEELEKVSDSAKYGSLTMTLTFSDGTSDTFRIHQKHAIGCCPEFRHNKKSHSITYRTEEKNVLVITVDNLETNHQND